MVRWRLTLGLDAQLVWDIYEMRECLEPRAAAFAAERGSAVEHAVISRAFEAMVASGADQVAAAESDVAFHTAVLLASGNPFLSSFTPMIEETLGACFGIARRRVDLSLVDLAQHEAVLQAILQRDPGSAECAATSLLQTSKAVQIAATADRVIQFESHRRRPEEGMVQKVPCPGNTENQ